MDKYLSICFDSKKNFIAGNCDPAKEYSYACRTFCDEAEETTTSGGGGGGGGGGDCGDVVGFTEVSEAGFCFQ